MTGCRARRAVTFRPIGIAGGHAHRCSRRQRMLGRHGIRFVSGLRGVGHGTGASAEGIVTKRAVAAYGSWSAEGRRLLVKPL